MRIENIIKDLENLSRDLKERKQFVTDICREAPLDKEYDIELGKMMRDKGESWVSIAEHAKHLFADHTGINVERESFLESLFKEIGFRTEEVLRKKLVDRLGVEDDDLDLILDEFPNSPFFDRATEEMSAEMRARAGEYLQAKREPTEPGPDNKE